MKKLVAALCLALIFSACSENSVQTATDKAPDFEISAIDGSPIRLSDHSGKVVILNFWATWCPPCIKELPDFVKFYSNYREKGLEILGIAVNSTRDNVVRMAEEHGITYPLAISDGRLESLYGGIRAVPTTIVIDREGRIAMKKMGAMSESDLVKAVENLL